MTWGLPGTPISRRDFEPRRFDDLYHGRQGRKVCRRSSARYLLAFGAQACRSDRRYFNRHPAASAAKLGRPRGNTLMPLVRRRSRPSVRATGTDRNGSGQLRATLFVEVGGVVDAASLPRRSIRVITRDSKAVAIIAWPSRVR
jgi:hypothetical protein